MNFHKTGSIFFATGNNAGGTDHVPPARCPRPACVSARAPANASATGRAVPNDFRRAWLGRHPREIRAVFLWEPFS
jgi:hypothetical protein